MQRPITISVSATWVAPNFNLPSSINGVPVEHIVVVPPDVQQHMREIAARGLAMGRNPRAFSKVGDSTMVWPTFLAAFDNPLLYALGPYIPLQPTITHFAGSFARASAAVRVGMQTWTEFDATWSPAGLCYAGEGPLACELRLHNPSFAIIRLGTNDALDARAFEKSMRRIIEYCLDNGVIPIIGSKPDRVEGPDNTINLIIYALADEYHIPLWDYDLIAETTPGKGLQDDGIHYLTYNPHDYHLPATFTYAPSLQDLTALIMLHTVRQAVFTEQ